jgi:N-acetylglucosamine transport system substrate-binding protein
MRIFFTSIVLVSVGFGLLVGSDTITRLSTDTQKEKVIEVAIFEGGYGIQWHQKMADRFNALHKDRSIRIELWGDPRTADIIKPRLLRGNPPDLILDERLPLWLLIGANKLTPYADALQQPPAGSTESWESQFAPGMLDMFNSNGNVYAIPAAYGAWTCWYDAKLFRDNGWSPPATWDEFIELCQTIKESGLAPIALQGKYASFYAWNTLVALIQRVGGLEAINRINALDPDAFSHPDVVEASRLFQELVTNYFQPGCMAMTHTESQLQFVNRQAAMIFCGIWLENEMKDTVPADFEMRTFTIPVPANGKGNPNFLHGQGMEFLFVPQDAAHPDEAFEFARFLVSPENAADMGESIGVISPLKGATPAESVTPALQSVLDIINRSEGIFNVRVYMLFPAWRSQVMNTAIGDLCRGDISPEEFGRALDVGLQKAVEETDLIIPDHIPFN